MGLSEVPAPEPEGEHVLGVDVTPDWRELLNAKKGRRSERKQQRSEKEKDPWAALRRSRESKVSKKDRSLRGKARIKARRAARRG